MLRVVIISLLITLVNSKSCNLTEQDVVVMQKAFKNLEPYMKREVGDEDAVICLGNARSGKSTLINLLIGNKLIAKKVGRIGEINLITVNNETKGPEIVAGRVSATAIPSKWKSSNLSLTIWDTPGFEDNRGELQDITNSFYIFQLLKHVKSLKFIVVITFSDIINDFSGPFVSVLSSVKEMFESNFEKLFPSITVVFSKAPNSYKDNPVNVDFIKNVLEEAYFSVPYVTLPDISKKFLRYVLSNNQIAFFREANREGEFIYNETDNIFQSIRKTISVDRSNIQDIHLIASKNAKTCLYELREPLLSSNAVSNFEETVLKVCSSRYKRYNGTIRNVGTLEIVALKVIVNGFLEYTDYALKSIKEFSKMVDFIKKIDESLINIVKRYNLIERIQLMEFYDIILKTKLIDQYQTTLLVVLDVCQTKFITLLKEMNYLLKLITQEELDEYLASEGLHFEIKYQSYLDKINYSENYNKNLGFFDGIFESLKRGLIQLSAYLSVTFGMD